MEVKYSLTRDEYIEFNIKYILNSKIIKKFFYIQKIAIAIVLSGMLFLFYREYKPSIWFITSVFLMVYIGGSLLEALFISFILKKKLNEKLDRKKDLLKAKHLRILDDGIHELEEDSDYLVKWKFVKKLEDVEEYIFLATEINDGYIIPKDQLNDVDVFLVELAKYGKQ